MKNMKKILSVILALLLLTATFAVAASAETAETTKVVSETPVGTADTGLKDEEFTSAVSSSGQTINVQVNEVQHRYAVDLTFDFADLTIDSDIVWNVKDMKYDVSNTNLKDSTRTIQVTNRSDMPVCANATAADSDDNDGVTITTSTANGLLTVDKATVGAGNTTGKSTTGKIDVTLVSTDWQKVAEYYAAKSIDKNATTFILTTVTVTISKPAN